MVDLDPLLKVTEVIDLFSSHLKNSCASFFSKTINRIPTKLHRDITMDNAQCRKEVGSDWLKTPEMAGNSNSNLDFFTFFSKAIAQIPVKLHRNII